MRSPTDIGGRRSWRAGPATLAVVALAATGCSTTAASADRLPPPDGAPGTTVATDPDPAASTPPTAAATTVPTPTTVTTTTLATVTATTPATVTTATPTTTADSGPTTTIPPELNPCPPNGDPKWRVRPPVPFPAPDVPAGWTARSIGTSVEGRSIVAHVRPALVEPSRFVVVIGALHGNEVTSEPTVRGMLAAEVPDDIELWLIPAANPDGQRVGIRCNANGVDLNRNFDWDWDPADGGPGPMSEPETRALADLIVGGEPDLVVWVHQPLDYIGPIGDTDPALAAAWSAASGVPVRRGITQHGGSETWTALVAGRPSILVEVEARDLTPELADAHRAGLEATLRAMSGQTPDP